MDYDKIASLYSFFTNLWTFGRIKKVWKTTAEFVPKDARVLEFGCGSGELAENIIPKVSSYYGIDSSVKMIDIANRKIKGKNVKFSAENAFEFNDYSKYDVLLCAGFFCELRKKDVEQLVKKISKNFKGSLVIYDEHIPNNTLVGRFWKNSRYLSRFLYHTMAGSPLEPIHNLGEILEKNGFSLQKSTFFFNDYRWVAVFKI